MTQVARSGRPPIPITTVGTAQGRVPGVITRLVATRLSYLPAVPTLGTRTASPQRRAFGASAGCPLRLHLTISIGFRQHARLVAPQDPAASISSNSRAFLPPVPGMRWSSSQVSTAYEETVSRRRVRTHERPV